MSTANFYSFSSNGLAVVDGPHRLLMTSVEIAPMGNVHPKNVGMLLTFGCESDPNASPSFFVSDDSITPPAISDSPR